MAIRVVVGVWVRVRVRLRTVYCSDKSIFTILQCAVLAPFGLLEELLNAIDGYDIVH